MILISMEIDKPEVMRLREKKVLGCIETIEFRYKHTCRKHLNTEKDAVFHLFLKLLDFSSFYPEKREKYFSRTVFVICSQL